SRAATRGGPRGAWLAGRPPRATTARAKAPGVHACTQGQRQKRESYEKLCRRWRVDPSEPAAMGDDEPDLPMLERAGFSACPADATEAARKASAVVLERCGGRGGGRWVYQFGVWVEGVRRITAKRGGR